MKILFFIPAHENIQVLKNCIENIQKYIEDPVIIVHANSTWVEFDEAEILSFKNTHILPQRYNFQKNTNMMHIIHHVFKHTLYFDYDYFTVFHTNCMFIKRGLEKYINDNEASFFEVSTFDHPNAGVCMDRSRLLNYVLKSQVYNSQVEGNFFRKDVFSKMIQFLENNLPELITDPYTGEECTIPTLTKMFTSVEKRVLPYLLIFYWWKNKNITIEDVEKFRADSNDVTIFYDISTKSSNVFSLKPINRSMIDPVRKYINSLP